MAISSGLSLPPPTNAATRPRRAPELRLRRVRSTRRWRGVDSKFQFRATFGGLASPRCAIRAEHCLPRCWGTTGLHGFELLVPQGQSRNPADQESVVRVAVPPCKESSPNLNSEHRSLWPSLSSTGRPHPRRGPSI